MLETKYKYIFDKNSKDTKVIKSDFDFDLEAIEDDIEIKEDTRDKEIEQLKKEIEQLKNKPEQKDEQKIYVMNVSYSIKKYEIHYKNQIHSTDIIDLYRLLNIQISNFNQISNNQMDFFNIKDDGCFGNSLTYNGIECSYYFSVKPISYIYNNLQIENNLSFDYQLRKKMKLIIR